MILKGKNIVILLLILVVAGLAAFIPLALQENQKPVYDSSSVFERIEPIREVSLIKYNYTGVAGYEDSRTIADIDIPLTKKHFLVKYDGYIKAGVDFEDISIDVRESKVEIKLPKAKIIESAIDEKSLVVYDESMNILNPIRIEDYNNVIIAEKEKMEAEAIGKGILEQAGDQAEIMIRSMITDMGFEEIKIIRAQG